MKKPPHNLGGFEKEYVGESQQDAFIMHNSSDFIKTASSGLFQSLHSFQNVVNVANDF